MQIIKVIGISLSFSVMFNFDMTFMINTCNLINGYLIKCYFVDYVLFWMNSLLAIPCTISGTRGHLCRITDVP